MISNYLLQDRACAINIRWTLKHELMNSRSESNILTRLVFYSPARQKETVYEKVKARHNCDWTVTIHDITSKYLEWMLLLLNSDHGAKKKTLKLNRFLAKFSASKHIKCSWTINATSLELDHQWDIALFGVPSEKNVSFSTPYLAWFISKCLQGLVSFEELWAWASEGFFPGATSGFVQKFF